MAARCWTTVRGRRIRATRVDECGAPFPAGTPCAYVVSKGTISIAYSPELFEGEEIEQVGSDGLLCISDPGFPEIKWFMVEIQFCQVDPELYSLLTGYPVVLDANGDAVGFRVTGAIETETGVALELWTDIPRQECVAGQKAYGYWLAPFLKHFSFGEVTVENGAVTFVMTGAKTFPFSQWGVGPWDVDRDAAGNPVPLLTPIGEDDHLDIHLTTVPPPAPECGCQPMPEESPSPVESPSPA